MAYAMLGTRGFFEFFRLNYDVTDGFFEIVPKPTLPTS